MTISQNGEIQVTVTYKWYKVNHYIWMYQNAMTFGMPDHDTVWFTYFNKNQSTEPETS